MASNRALTLRDNLSGNTQQVGNFEVDDSGIYVARPHTSISHVLFDESARLDAAAGGTYYVTRGAGAVAATHADVCKGFIYIDAAHLAFSGTEGSVQLRLSASVAVNATAPTAKLNVKLYPVTATVGGAADVHGTVGAAEAANLEITAAELLALVGVAGSYAFMYYDIDVPAAGLYVVGLTLDGAMAVGSALAVNVNVSLVELA
jgi:hypothetical protein